MELKAYHLRTWRVSGLNEDMTHKIEDITVKLVGESSLEKYCKFLPINGFVQNKPPKIVKVLARSDKGEDKGKWIELGKESIIEAQERVDKLVNIPIPGKKIDYKSEFEDQKKLTNELKVRLEALESKPKPGPKKKSETNES